MQGLKQAGLQQEQQQESEQYNDVTNWQQQ
jgi:hypothetical protein